MSPNQYVSDLRAERDALRAKVARVECVIERLNKAAEVYSDLTARIEARHTATALRRALSGDLRSTGSTGYTESEPAVTTRQATTQGAGDGV